MNQREHGTISFPSPGFHPPFLTSPHDPTAANPSFYSSFLPPSRLRFRVQFTCALLFHCPCHDGLLYSTIFSIGVPIDVTILTRYDLWFLSESWHISFISDSRSPRVLRSDFRCWLSECGTSKANCSKLSTLRLWLQVEIQPRRKRHHLSDQVRYSQKCFTVLVLHWTESITGKACESGIRALQKHLVRK